MQEPHDLHSFIASSQRLIEEEYVRIQRRATEDPGTAGDQGEENWATLFKSWLPSYFQVVTKGRILTQSGYASPQIDVLVLVPSYPKILLDKKLYLAGGVAAAFECKTTLTAAHVTDAVRTAVALRSNLPAREGNPYLELNSGIIYGLLAHSHSWTGDKSKPVENIENALITADQQYVQHPVQMLDLVCVADLATWRSLKISYLSDTPGQAFTEIGTCNTSYTCGAVGAENQTDYFSPIGLLLSSLFSKLSWAHHEMRNLDQYFREVNLQGSGKGTMRVWNYQSIYSDSVRAGLRNGLLSSNEQWSLVF